MSRNLILWLDFETTGLDIRDDEILEVAWVLTDENLMVLDSYQSLVTPERLDWKTSMNGVVRDMHTTNSLISEIENLTIVGKTIPLAWVESETLLCLDHGDHWQEGDRLYLAGAGVSHFDYFWIMEHMPRLGKRLHYSQLDISIVKRMVSIFAGSSDWVFGTHPVAPEVSHRAMTDVRKALAEAEEFRKFMNIHLPLVSSE